MAWSCFLCFSRIPTSFSHIQSTLVQHSPALAYWSDVQWYPTSCLDHLGSVRTSVARSSRWVIGTVMDLLPVTKCTGAAIHWIHFFFDYSDDYLINPVYWSFCINFFHIFLVFLFVVWIRASSLHRPCAYLPKMPKILVARMYGRDTYLPQAQFVPWLCWQKPQLWCLDESRLCVIPKWWSDPMIRCQEMIPEGTKVRVSSCVGYKKRSGEAVSPFPSCACATGSG